MAHTAMQTPWCVSWASVPIYQGAHASLCGTMIDARVVHGQNGLEHVELAAAGSVVNAASTSIQSVL